MIGRSLLCRRALLYNKSYNLNNAENKTCFCENVFESVKERICCIFGRAFQAKKNLMFELFFRRIQQKKLTSWFLFSEVWTVERCRHQITNDHENNIIELVKKAKEPSLQLDDNMIMWEYNNHPLAIWWSSHHQTSYKEDIFSENTTFVNWESCLGGSLKGFVWNKNPLLTTQLKFKKQRKTSPFPVLRTKCR